MRRMARWAVGAWVGAWTLGCMLPTPHDDDHDTLEAGEDEEVPPPDGTTLWGTWGGDVSCPDGSSGTLVLDLVHEGPSYFEGPAILTFDDGSEYESFVAVAYGSPSEAAVFALDVAVTDCTDGTGEPTTCDLIENAVWDQSVLPAHISGEIVEADTRPAPCTFELRAFYDWLED